MPTIKTISSNQFLICAHRTQQQPINTNLSRFLAESRNVPASSDIALIIQNRIPYLIIRFSIVTLPSLTVNKKSRAYRMHHPLAARLSLVRDLLHSAPFARKFRLFREYIVLRKICTNAGIFSTEICKIPVC
jgi:hypothetical protein